MGFKDLAARTASVTGRTVEKVSDKEPRTAPVMMYDVTNRMHEAEKLAEELQYELENVKKGQLGIRQKIPLDMIDDSPYQPRTIYDAAELDDLCHSMAAAGIKEPIRVRRKANNRFELIAGHRRARGGRSLGWREIDAYVEECSDRDAKLETMIANEARIDLTDYEKGKLYQEAMADGFANNQNELANLFGTSQSHVSMRMAMLKLPPFFTAILDDNPASFGVKCANSIAQLLKQYPEESKLIEAAVLRIKEGADQSSVKPWVQQMVKQKHAPQKHNEPATITNRAGRPIFTARVVDRELSIKIKAPEIDAKEIEEMVLEVLRKRADEQEGGIING